MERINIEMVKVILESNKKQLFKHPDLELYLGMTKSDRLALISDMGQIISLIQFEDISKKGMWIVVEIPLLWII
jgi:hypothetical protein